MTKQQLNKVMDADQFMSITVNYWEGAFEDITDDFPDGAWWAMHEDGFRYHKTIWADTMELCDFPPWPECADSNDLMHAYLKALSVAENG